LKKEYIIPIFVPHLGCPNNCIFCNQKNISAQTKEVTPKEIKETIEYYLKNFKDNHKYVEVAFFGGSFTAIEKEKQKELLEAVQPYINEKKVKSIRVSTRPDAINKDILKMLKKYNVKTIELGVQSMNNYILQRCKRGHTVEDVKKASRLIKRNRFILGHQMMIGLPESTLQDEINTTRELIKIKPKIVRIYPVLVIKDTELAIEYDKEEYTPLTLTQAVERCKEVVNLFNKKHIQVIRIGLQNTEEISDPTQESSQVIAGPFHPAFRQLVESSMWYDSILKEIKKINTKVIEIKIIANVENINNIIGHKKENVLKLKEIYNLDVSVESNDKMKPGKFKLEILKTYE